MRHLLESDDDMVVERVLQIVIILVVGFLLVKHFWP